MAKIEINAELCKSCRYCLGACPQKIMRLSNIYNSKGYRVAEQFDSDKCNGCKLCAIVCPECAIEVYK
jgi:2-oxoglutarate ferredoxin oxidoreductase subunit delta